MIKDAEGEVLSTMVDSMSPHTGLLRRPTEWQIHLRIKAKELMQ